MIAMVMCAGEGTRLRPLTWGTPKPMVPVANKPVLQYTLENLKRQGISEVVINLSYLPEKIQAYFKDGSWLGMKIHYSVEEKLLGTAGGVKRAEKYFRRDSDPDFLVTSGDGLSDVDFTRLIQLHKNNRSLGSMALKRVDQRMEYGITLTDERGKIKQFVEKPSWSDVFSNSVNTGIYVFSKEIFAHIPAKSFYDFGKQVWPELLRTKKNIFGFDIEEYWTDIGNLSEYRRAQRSVLSGEVRVEIDGVQVRDKVWVGEGTRLDPKAKVEAPCLIGKRCKIAKNATIGAHTVIGDGSVIESGARILESTLWSKSIVGSGAEVSNCIVGSRFEVPERFSLHEGTIFKGNK